jgi:hypothetical protein
MMSWWLCFFFLFHPILLDVCLGHESSQFVKLLKLYSDVLSVLISASCGLFACVMQKEKVSHSSIFRCCFRFVLY